MKPAISLKSGRIPILMALAGVLLWFALVRLGYLFPLRTFPQVLCIKNCGLEPTIHPIPADETALETAYVNDGKPLDALLPNDVDPALMSILIEKAQNRLTLFYAQQPLKAYPVVFGENPLGDKRREGDRKTPEGIFKIQAMYDHDDWSRFMWIDYPNPQAWREHYRAKLTGKLNWFMPIGGQVGIHGVPQGQNFIIDQKINWTWGCPSLKNADVIEIYNAVQVGTLVEIVP